MKTGCFPAPVEGREHREGIVGGGSLQRSPHPIERLVPAGTGRSSVSDSTKVVQQVALRHRSVNHTLVSEPSRLHRKADRPAVNRLLVVHLDPDRVSGLRLETETDHNLLQLTRIFPFFQLRISLSLEF